MITSGHDAPIGAREAQQQRAALAGYPPPAEGYERTSASEQQHGAYTRGADGLLYPAARAHDEYAGGAPRPSTAPSARARQFRYV